MATYQTTAAQIRAAVADLGRLEPPWAERYQAGARLLANGGWHQHEQFVTFPGSIVARRDACSCQEGGGPVLCLHRVALLVLDHAAGWPALEGR